MRKLPLFLAILIAPFASPMQAFACSCIYYENEAERFSAYYERSDLITLGTVTTVEDTDNNNQIRYTISVEKTWKGEADAYINVETANNEAACGIALPVDERVVLFASLHDGTYATNLCTGTVVLEGNEDMLTQLDNYLGPPEKQGEEEPDCSPYMCKNGETFPACSDDGTFIAYFAPPCMFSGGQIDPDEIPEDDTMFTDVPDTHPLQEPIAFVKNEGIVQGYDDGTYKPDQLIDRYEFVKILIEASGGLTNNQYCKIAGFSDTDHTQWYYPYVRKAACSGIVSGYPGGSFGGTKNINLAEAAKIVVNTFAIPVELDGEPWWKPYIVALSSVGGLPPRLTDPNQAITRGDMADIIYRVMMGM